MKNVAEFIRKNRDRNGRPMQTFIIDGKKITTNFGDHRTVIWDGNYIPEKYTNHKKIDLLATKEQVLERAIADGYTEIRFVETTTCTPGYHHDHVWLKK